MHVGFGVDHFPVTDIPHVVLAGHPFGPSVNPAGQPVHDLVWHALADALLGATGEAGLRQYRKDKGETECDSSLMAGLERHIHYAGWKVINTDITLCYPDCVSHDAVLQPIRDSVAKTLFINVDQVTVKDTLFPGDANSSHYITCYAIVSVGPRNL